MNHIVTAGGTFQAKVGAALRVDSTVELVTDPALLGTEEKYALVP